MVANSCARHTYTPLCRGHPHSATKIAALPALACPAEPTDGTRARPIAWGFNLTYPSTTHARRCAVSATLLLLCSLPDSHAWREPTHGASSTQACSTYTPPHPRLPLSTGSGSECSRALVPVCRRVPHPRGRRPRVWDRSATAQGRPKGMNMRQKPSHCESGPAAVTKSNQSPGTVPNATDTADDGRHRSSCINVIQKRRGHTNGQRCRYEPPDLSGPIPQVR